MDAPQPAQVVSLVSVDSAETRSFNILIRRVFYFPLQHKAPLPSSPSPWIDLSISQRVRGWKGNQRYLSVNQLILILCNQHGPQLTGQDSVVSSRAISCPRDSIERDWHLLPWGGSLSTSSSAATIIYVFKRAPTSDQSFNVAWRVMISFCFCASLLLAGS